MASIIEDGQVVVVPFYNSTTGRIEYPTRATLSAPTMAVPRGNKPLTRVTTGTYSTAPKTKATSTTSRSTGTSTRTQAALDPAARARAEAAAAEARATAAANNSARTGANDEINRLNAQITANEAKKTTNVRSLEALKKLVGGGPDSHSSVRDSALKALDDSLTAKLTQLREVFGIQSKEFEGNLRDNEASEADDSFANFANRAREKQDLVGQALSQGAGESDVLQTQLQALRNWSANQSEVNRAYFDTRSSINASIADLNTATKTGMMNEELSTSAAKSQRYDDYFNAMGRTYADMANLDQQNYLLEEEISAAEKQKETSVGLTAWLDSGKNASDWKAPTLSTTAAAKPREYTSEYAQRSAEMAGSAWKAPDVSDATKNFTGQEQSTGTLTSTQAWNSQRNELGTPKRKRPEGAQLRTW